PPSGCGRRGWTWSTTATPRGSGRTPRGSWTGWGVRRRRSGWPARWGSSGSAPRSTPRSTWTCRWWWRATGRGEPRGSPPQPHQPPLGRLRLELPARRGDVAPARLAHRDRDPRPLQPPGEGPPPLRRTRLPVGARDRVEGDQVHEGGELPDHLRQLSRQLRRVVDPVDHHVLEGDPLPPRRVELPEGVEQLRERV